MSPAPGPRTSTRVGSWLKTHRRSLLFGIFLAAGGGIGALFTLPVSLLPRTTFPRIVVSADAGDRPAARMVVEVTRPLEEAVRTVPGVLGVRSTTSRGSCDVAVRFKWGLDMVSAQLQVEAAIAQVLPSLPAGLSHELRRMDPTVFPILGLSLTSPSRSQVALRDLALFSLRPVVSSVKGVAKVKVLGGRAEEYQVLLDPARLEATGVTLPEVTAAVSASNVVEAVGRLEEDEKLYLIVSDTQFHDPAELGRVIIRQGPSGNVFLSDLGTVRKSERPAWTRVSADGRDAVLVNIYQQPDGNTVHIAGQVQERLRRLKKRLPKDVQMSVWYDQSELISASVSSVRDAILVGIGLAVIVLLLFLRSWKISLVVCLAVPVVLATTALLLHVFHLGINVMTLGGMAAAVGLIIDDAIVMVEPIVRRLREAPSERQSAISAAASEMLSALTGSSAATIVIFIPLAFLSGVTGAFFKALSLTIASALIVSFFFAATAVPALAGFLLRDKDARGEAVGRIWQAILAGYTWLLHGMLRRPLLLIVFILPLLVLGWVSFQGVGSGFLPPMDEGGFILDYRAPPGTSLAETDRRLRLVEKILAKMPEVATYSRRTGLALGGSITEANEGDYFIRLTPFPRRPMSEVMDEVREKVGRHVPGLEIELAQLMEDLIGDLTAVPQPIEIKLFGEKQETLRALAQGVAHAVSAVPNVVDVKSGVVLAGETLQIRTKRLKAQVLGLKASDVTRLAAIALRGEVVTRVRRGEKMVGVRVWTPRNVRARQATLRKLRLKTPSGAIVSLGRVATFKVLTGRPQIVRENLKSMVAVTGRISGRDMGSVIHDVKRAVSALGLPKSVTVTYGGLYRQQQKSFAALLAVLIAATGLVFALLLFLYERFAAPLAILLIDLLAATGVFSGLFWTGTELNISAMMGLTMIMGIASEAAIFYMSQWKDLGDESSPEDRLVKAGKLRARPIVMTALAAILALAPLAAAVGEGAALLKPLAIAIISGLVLTVPLVLLVLPVIFFILHGTKGMKRPPKRSIS